MDPTVEAAMIGAAAALIGVGGTVVVAISGARNSRRTNQATLDAAHADALLAVSAAREAQLPDRYSRALEQIGSTDLYVRIGGIYALEGIVHDSPGYHRTVMDVLSDFIRGNSYTAPGDSKPELWPHADVQAALTVVCRRKAEYDLNLDGVDLSNAKLDGANLRGASLRAANLTGAKLKGANLTDASLEGANLTAANLAYAYLAKAHFADAILVNAELLNTDLTCAKFLMPDLTGAHLANATLIGTELIGANLTGASLMNANLTDADLTRVVWPAGRSLPEGWIRDPDSASGQLMRPGKSLERTQDGFPSATRRSTQEQRRSWHEEREQRRQRRRHEQGDSPLGPIMKP